MNRQRPYITKYNDQLKSGAKIQKGLEVTLNYQDKLSSLAVRATIIKETIANLEEIFWGFRRIGVKKIFLCPVSGEGLSYRFTRIEANSWITQLTNLVWNIIIKGDIDDIQALPQVFDFLLNLVLTCKINYNMI